jgi:hypothetical protein
MPSTETSAQCFGRHPAAERAELRPEHDYHADQPEAETGPVARQDGLAQKPAGEHCRDQRLQADDQG